MIKLNLKNAIKDISILKYKRNIRIIGKRIENLESEGFEWLGWKDYPKNIHPREIGEINQTAKRLLKQNVELLVVIGIGGSFLGTRAAIEMIQGEYPEKQKIEIMYVGESTSSSNLEQKLIYAENKNFAINVVSKFGNSIETGIAFRLFKKLLEDKVGIYNSTKFVFVTTDANKGKLFQIAKEKKYKVFSIPTNVGERFSVLTPVGLFPMACAGIDIEKIITSAKKANEIFKNPNVNENIAYKYAVARIILSKNFKIELMVQYEPQMKSFNEWWKQLVSETEGKNQRGLFPTSAIFSTDLHSLGQFIQDGTKILFETVMTVKKTNSDLLILSEEKNLDNLNYLSNNNVHHINQITFKAVTEAHVKIAKIPNIHIQFDKMDEEGFGELVMFFQRAIIMSAYLLKLNPFSQPGVEIYKQNMFKILEKPE